MANSIYCPRCGNLGAVPLPSTNNILCDFCRDFKAGIIPLDYLELAENQSSSVSIDKKTLITLNRHIIQLTITHEEQATRLQNLTKLIESL